MILIDRLWYDEHVTTVRERERKNGINIPGNKTSLWNALRGLGRVNPSHREQKASLLHVRRSNLLPNENLASWSMQKWIISRRNNIKHYPGLFGGPLTFIVIAHVSACSYESCQWNSKSQQLHLVCFIISAGRSDRDHVYRRPRRAAESPKMLAVQNNSSCKSSMQNYNQTIKHLMR